MTKEEFINELRNKLVGLPKEELENRLNYYEEMIEDRMDEGKTEEEAVAEIGNVDDIAKQITDETPLITLVKEQTKPKRSLKVWEIVLLFLGFPLWFPLVLTGLILCFVAYLLIWVFVIVSYSIEFSFAVASIASLVGFLIYLGNGEVNLIALGLTIMCLGVAILFVFVCIAVTKMTIKLSKTVLLKIKSAIIGKESK